MSNHLDSETGNTFKTAFSTVAMPEATRSTIEAEIARERAKRPARQALAVIDGTARRPLITRRRMLAVAACTGLIVIGGVALGTYLAGRPTDEHLRAATENGGFVLRAYADGTPLASDSKIIASNKIITNLSSSWSEDDPDAAGRPTFGIIWGIDLAYLGTNVERVEFSIQDGDEVAFTWSAPDASGDGKSPSWGTGSSVTIDRSNRGASATNYNVSFHFTADEETQRAHDAYRESASRGDGAAADGGSSEKLMDAYRYASYLQAAKLLSQTPVTAAATLASGGKVTHAYRISPIADFVQQGLANERAYWETDTENMSAAELRKFEESQPALFTIEQLS